MCAIQGARVEHFAAYIGLDVHKDTIACSVAFDGRLVPTYGGEIKKSASKIAKLVEQIK